MANETSNQANDGYIFNVLHEEVSDTDAFKEKTHKRISQSLYSLITTAKKACTIGLEGAWGSGKSTVINLLRNKLKADQNDDAKERTLFYVFDAWAHDGDTLRKTFLEELILEVAKDNNIKPKQLDPRLKEIRERASGRKKTITTENTKQISNYAKWLAVSILAFPLGATLLSKVEFDKLYAPWDKIAGDINWLFFFGIVFTSLPFVITLFNAIRSYIDPDYSFALLNPNHKETLTQSITQDIDRTSLEFEGFFKKIMSYLLTGTRRQSYARVILVIDNLDRIDSEHAKNIWITLQTFFQHRSGNVNAQDKDWLDRVWFIVPFDREGLSKIWDGNSPHPQVVLSNKDEFGLQATYDYSNTKAQLADSYIDKCFQIVVEVPQAIPNNWIGYLKEKMREAFSNSYSKSDVNMLIDTFIGYESSLEISPTPRKINTVINRIGMLGLQWGQQFGVQAYCLYALLRQANNSIELRQKLVSKNIPLSFLNIDSSTLYPELSGLFFGVPKEQGMQLLLVPVIEQYIEEEKYDELKKLVLSHSQAFWIAWSAFDNQKSEFTSPHANPKLCERGHQFLKKALTLISELLNDDEIDKQTKNNIPLRHTRYSLASAIESWLSDISKFENSLAEIIDTTIQISGIEKLNIEKINEQLTRRLIGISPQFNSEKNADKAESLNNVFDVLHKHKFPLNIDHPLSLTIKEWLEWAEQYGHLLHIFGYFPPPEGITATLIKKENEKLLYKLLPLVKEERDTKQILEYFGNLEPNVSIDIARFKAEFSYNEETLKSMLFLILHHSSDTQIGKIKNTIQTQKFWNGLANLYWSDDSLKATIYLLAAATYEKVLFNDSFVAELVKEYWNNDNNLSKNDLIIDQQIIEILKEIGQLNYLQKLANIEGYNYAKQIVANNPELFTPETSE